MHHHGHLVVGLDQERESNCLSSPGNGSISCKCLWTCLTCKVWSHASISQLDFAITKNSAAGVMTAESTLTLGWTSPLHKQVHLAILVSTTVCHGTFWKSCYWSCQEKQKFQLFNSLPPDSEVDYYLLGELQWDIMLSLKRMGGLCCISLSPKRGAHCCQCNELTGRDQQHPSITPLTAWNAAISLPDSSRWADRLHSAVNEVKVLGDRNTPKGISHDCVCLSRATALIFSP